MTTAKKTLRIQQIRSSIGVKPIHREALRSLGLRRIRHVVEREDSPVVRGLLSRVSHLVLVEEKSS
jgi:large subunit ribosomal protein L30